VVAQTAPNKYWIAFANKSNSPYSVTQPLNFLSQRAIDRRTRMNIPITMQDFPVNPAYLDSIRHKGAVTLNASRWHNGVTIYTNDTSILASIRALPFVQGVQKTLSGGKSTVTKSMNGIMPYSKLATPIIQQHAPIRDAKNTNSFSYGYATPQISMIKGEYLHQLGYAGDGMLIGVIDAGFTHVDVLPAFDSLWINNQIVGYKDFVDPSSDIFEQSTHGMMVLSIMGGNITDSLVGTAPKASYLLLRSEDGNSENLVEEDNWVAAVEYADSMGVDVVNSSLGYTTFDDTTLVRTYADMTGRKSRASLAATYAARRGMILCISAGNSAENPWHFIGVPADADSVLTVGAVDEDRNYASFSSVGPSADGRVKPDVATMGLGTYVEGTDSIITYGNGTSFSSPVLAGTVACLWQAFPNKTNFEVMDAVRRSASQFNSPDTLLGFGIPNFQTAYQLLMPNGVASERNHTGKLSIYPNPAGDDQPLMLSFESSEYEPVDVAVFNSFGSRVHHDTLWVVPGLNVIPFNGHKNLSPGIYYLQINASKFSFSNGFVKR
jgi:hypothetical protein